MKLSGHEKASSRLAPNFLLRFISNFNKDSKSIRAYFRIIYNSVISKTLNTFDWEPMYLKNDCRFNKTYQKSSLAIYFKSQKFDFFFNYFVIRGD